MQSVLATQVLNFFQTSKKNLYWSSLLALVLAFLSFQFWQQIFTTHNIPVQVQLATQRVEKIRVYWDNLEHYPNAYEQIVVKPSSSQLWEVKVEALAQKNSQSKGQEVWIFDISTPENQGSWWSKPLINTDSWKLENHNLGAQGKVVIADGVKPQSLNVFTKGSKLNIKLLRHPWSGKVRITVNDRVSEIDLFERSSKIETLTFSSVTSRDEIVENYTINLVDTPWHRLKFVAEGEGKVTVKNIQARGQVITPYNGEFVLPFKFWNRFSCAVVASIISFFWMTCLFISVVHLWQEQAQKRFGIVCYIVGFSITLAGFWTLVFYPGLMVSDSVANWITGLSMFKQIEPVPWSLTNWFPPMMSWLMGLTYLFSRECGLFTFIQIFLFYLSCFLLLNMLKSKRLFLILVVFLIVNPAIWNQAATVVRDVWTCTGLNFALWSILNFTKDRDKNAKIGLVIVFLFFCTILFSFRYNSITTLPAIAISIWRFVKSIQWKSVLCACCLLAILVASIPPHIFGLSKVNVSSVIIAWEHIGTLKTIARPEALKNHNLDYIGDTKIAVKKYDCNNLDNLIWGDRVSFDTPLPAGKILEHSERIKRSFQSLILAYPQEFILNKLCIYGEMLGLSNRVKLSVIHPYSSSDDKAYATIYQPKIKNIGENLVALLGTYRQNPFPIFTPWSTLIFLIFIVYISKLSKISHLYLMPTIALALSYYGGFFIFSAGMYFRYFLPTYVLILIAITYAIEGILDRIKSVKKLPLSVR